MSSADTLNVATGYRTATGEPMGLGRHSEYLFVQVEKCNMCGAPADRARILGRRLNTRQGLRPQRRVGIATTVVQCDQCGLIYANAMPVPKSIAQHYGVPPESYWKPEYFVVDPNYFRPQIGQFERLYGRPIAGTNLKALDVGAGIGKAMIAFASAGFESFGLEPSEPFYRRAIDRMGISPDRLQLGAVEDVGFDPESFDFINMAAVVEHFYNPGAAIRKAIGWLKPGGFIYVEVPSSAYLVSRLARWFYRATGSDYVINLCPMHPPYHLYEFAPKSFELHARAHGYRIAHQEIFIFRSYLPKPVGPLLSHTMKKTNTGMQLAVWLTKHAARTDPEASGPAPEDGALTSP